MALEALGIARKNLLRAAGLAWLAMAGAAGADQVPAIAPERMRELVRLVREDCGSCHGMTLKGGLGPALLPASLAGKPAESLKYVILKGRPGTPMPGWAPFLSDQEAGWIAGRLTTGFPQE